MLLGKQIDNSTHKAKLGGCIVDAISVINMLMENVEQVELFYICQHLV